MLDTKLLNPARQKEPVRILVAEACLAQPAGTEGMQHVDIGQEITVTRRDARQLTYMGRAFYLQRTDDHAAGALTVSLEVQRRIDCSVQAIREERERREKARAAALGRATDLVGEAPRAALEAGRVGK